MLRLRLTTSDLQQVIIAAAPAPVLELTNLVRAESLLGSPRWREHLRRRGVDVTDLGRFTHLFGSACSPGFLHPVASDARDAIQDIASTPPATVRHDLRQMAHLGHPRDSWTLDLAGVGPAAARLRGRLANTLTTMLTSVVEPRLEEARVVAAARCEQLAAVQRAHGAAGVLNALDRRIRYLPPYLEVDLSSGAEVEAASDGAGLILVPSLTTVPTITVSDTGRPTMLTFSLVHSRRDAAFMAASPRRELTRLIGVGRAEVLAGVAAWPGVGTRELGRRIGLSAASTSHHLSVLRENGLIATVVMVERASHHVTPRGHELLGHEPAGPDE